ncbi:MAG: hypothetical protein IJV72_03615 [Clostridia bacterium]|nr:hypothetical protein [Clostridia bacterium]
MNKKTTLLIMAAGLGSRYGGNKQVDGIGPNGEILMQYSIYDAIKAGFNKIVFVIKQEHEALIRRFCEGIVGAETVFVYQDFSSIPSIYAVPADRVKPFGTVHAVLCARDAINEPFAIINADDYYGADAFRTMYEKLQNLSEREGTMVAYKLKNTVSRNGAVTRGICGISDGKLTDVKETYKITVNDEGDIMDADDGLLDPEVLVSMNMWGFVPDVFEDMDDSFKSFLSGIAQGDVKAEYALPTMVDSFIKSAKMSVSVLSTDSVWFGVTYKEDKPFVAGELKKMHESGAYPEKL